jgi:hypothetical protein
MNQVISVLISLLGVLLKKYKSDAELEKKFFELADLLESKAIISSVNKWNREDDLTELELKRQKARKESNENN